MTKKFVASYRHYISSYIKHLAMVLEDEYGKTTGTDTGALVYNHRPSTVVPASVTGEVTYELDNRNLLFKLHYLRGVYYFRPSEVVQGLTTRALKDPMFPWLDTYFPVAGRIRRTEAGRPYIKCNDCGVRIVEAKCDKTVDEWLETNMTNRLKHLVYDKVLGPDLLFSPMLYIQVTNFKCGGLAIGFSWAHLIGDVASAVSCIDKWVQILNEKQPSKTDLNCRNKPEEPPASVAPHSVKLTGPVEDYWMAPNSCKMAWYSFHITESKLENLQLQESVHDQVGYFQLISALMWQTLAKIRGAKEVKTVTICKTDMSARSGKALSNEQKIGYVTTDSSPAKTDIAELAMLITKEQVDETKLVAALVDDETGKGDVIVYGANLTFVDMQEVEFYHGMEIKGQKPVHVEHGIDGVGDEGAILVHQDSDMKGRFVTAILPEDEVERLRVALGNAWGIA